MYTSQKKQYTHPDTKSCINIIQTHRTEATKNKAKTYINKGAITKERPTGQKINN